MLAKSCHNLGLSSFLSSSSYLGLSSLFRLSFSFVTFFLFWGRFHFCGHFEFLRASKFVRSSSFSGAFLFSKIVRTHTHRQIYRDFDIMATAMLRPAVVKNSISLKLSILCQWLSFIFPGIKSGEQ